MIKLYIQDECPSCKTIENMLDKEDIKYETYDITLFDDIVDRATKQEIYTTPIAEIDGCLYGFADIVKYIKNME